MGWSISLRNRADKLPSAAAKENTGESVIDYFALQSWAILNW